MTLEELNDHFALIDDLHAAQEALVNLQLAVQPHTASITGMPHASGFKDKVGDLAAEMADMEARISDTQEEIRRSEDRIIEFIQTIDDCRTSLIFRLRYIRGLSWQEVAEVIGGRNTSESVKMICYRYLKNGPVQAGMRHRKALKRKMPRK